MSIAEQPRRATGRLDFAISADLLDWGQHQHQPRAAMFTGGFRAYLAEVRPGSENATNEGTATIELTTTTNASVDGVMQRLGGLDEARSGGFERGEWTDLPLIDYEGVT